MALRFANRWVRSHNNPRGHKHKEQTEFKETLGDLSSTLTNLRNVLEQITEP